MIQGEAMKYFWASINRHRKFNTFCSSLGGVMEFIGGKMSKSMDYKVGTLVGQSDRLQVLIV